MEVRRKAQSGLWPPCELISALFQARSCELRGHRIAEIQAFLDSLLNFTCKMRSSVLLVVVSRPSSSGRIKRTERKSGCDRPRLGRQAPHVRIELADVRCKSSPPLMRPPDENTSGPYCGPQWADWPVSRHTVMCSGCKKAHSAKMYCAKVCTTHLLSAALNRNRQCKDAFYCSKEVRIHGHLTISFSRS